MSFSNQREIECTHNTAKHRLPSFGIKIPILYIDFYHEHFYLSVFQNIGTGVAPRTVHIDNQAVETVNRFTYLGSDIDSDGYSYPEIHRRLGIAGSIMA